MKINREMVLQSFREEAEELLVQMEQSLLALESQPDDRELVSSIFRVAHTLKGNASLLEFKAVAQALHSLEDLLDSLRKGTVTTTTEVINLLLQSVDILRQMTKRMLAGEESLLPAHERFFSRLALVAAESKPSVVEASAETTTRAASAAASGAKSAQSLRVDLGKMDRMLNLTVEFAIAQGRLRRMLQEKYSSYRTGHEVLEVHQGLESLFLQMQELVMKIRMVPVGPIFHRFARSVRDAARAHGKFANLRIEGEDVEVDTSVVEHLKDPLLHMIRNAVDHGIETPEDRKKKGKPSVGTITIRAAHEGGYILVEVSDDGAGLNRQRIIEIGQKRGFIPEAEKLSDKEVHQLIFESGFSTAAEVNDLSGRGVGMDVVRRNVQALRGSVEVSSQPGAGTTVHIRLPLTLAIIEGFSVGVGDETYVIPVEQVVECVELPAAENDAVRSEGILQLRNQPLPFIYLRDHFDLPGERIGRQNIVVVQHGASRAGLAVDVLHGTTQTVIKPLPTVFKTIPGVSGSAILGNGRVALILDVPALLRDFRVQEMQLV